MNKKVLITADSACDFSPEMAGKYNVKLVPLSILLGDTEYKDNGVDVTPTMLYDYYSKTKQTPKTAAPTLMDYGLFFKEHAGNDVEVLHISFAGALSSSYNNAAIASKRHDNVFVVDSKTLFAGYAMLVVLATRLRDKGKSAKEICNYVSTQRNKVRVSFIVPDLTYLSRGGRCSSITALGANVLGIKPAIEMEDGKLSTGKKYRGKEEVAFMQYFTDKLDFAKENADKSLAFLGHSGMPEESFAPLRKVANDRSVFDELIEMRAGCVTSSHCGPGTVSLIFMEK